MRQRFKEYASLRLEALTQTQPSPCSDRYVCPPPTNPCPSSTVTGADVLGTLSALNDMGAATATVLNQAGADTTGAAGGFVRAAPFGAAVVSGVTLLHGYHSGNSEREFSGGYGLATLLASAIPVGGRCVSR